MTCCLDDMHWGIIKEHAFTHISTGEESDEGISGFDDDTGKAMSLHAIIELDW